MRYTTTDVDYDDAFYGVATAAAGDPAGILCIIGALCAAYAACALYDACARAYAQARARARAA